MATPNLISVERAIQRELAFRRRTEAMQFGPHSFASSAAATPLQQFGGQCGVPFGAATPLQFGNHGAPFSGAAPFQDPFLPSTSGTKRKSPYIDVPPFRPRQPQSQPPRAKTSHLIHAKVSCTLCQEAFPNTFYLDKHCEGTKHKSKIARNKLSHVNVSNPFMCELCKATSSSRITLEQHLVGRRHRQALDTGLAPGPSRPRDPPIDISNITWESF